MMMMRYVEMTANEQQVVKVMLKSTHYRKETFLSTWMKIKDS